jgi:hypothetical protein
VALILACLLVFFHEEIPNMPLLKAKRPSQKGAIFEFVKVAAPAGGKKHVPSDVIISKIRRIVIGWQIALLIGQS